MSQPFLGEIKIIGFNFAPQGFALCNGQTMSISQNSALFSLLGTTYGGNGTTTFMLPNLRDSAPMGAGNGPGRSPRALGQTSGSAAVTLTSPQLPVHIHIMSAALLTPPNPAQNTSTPNANAMLGPSNPGQAYNDPGGPTVTMAPQTLGATGGNAPHENRQPFIALNFVIAVQGIYPTRN